MNMFSLIQSDSTGKLAELSESIQSFSVAVIDGSVIYSLPDSYIDPSSFMSIFPLTASIPNTESIMLHPIIQKVLFSINAAMCLWKQKRLPKSLSTNLIKKKRQDI